MSRKEEYEALLRELERTPDGLENTVERALKRSKASRKKRRIWGVPAGSLAACFVGFVLLVNLFPPFALACGNVPLLRELAKAVAWSPSLSAAVENEYVQPMDQTQSQNGITATVHYVIVDRKKASFFYSLDYDKDLGDRVEVDYAFGDIHGWAGTAGSYCEEAGELKEIDMTFVDRDVPDAVDLTIKVYTTPLPSETEPAEENFKDDMLEEVIPEEPNYLAEFTFHLEFDPYFTAQGEVIPVDTAFDLAGQTFTLTEAEVYPTHLRLNLDDSPANTAWLKGLDLYLENEHGERFESAVNGISASGDLDGEGYASFWLDSPFFSKGEHLTLHISQAKWRSKDAPLARLDLEKGTAEGLPEGVQLAGAERRSGGWVLTFTAPLGADRMMYSLFNGTYWDENEAAYTISQSGSSYGYSDPETGAYVDDMTVFTETIPLAGFDGGVVYLEPIFDTVTVFDTPVAIPIK